MAGAGRVAIVTGASAGIGQQVARRLAASGDELVLIARGQTDLDLVAKECLDLGAASATVFAADVGDADAVERVFEDVAGRFGRVDVVVHSAGVAAYGRFVDLPREVVEGVLRTNVVGTLNVARSALTRMSASGHGDLVLLGSLLGDIVTPYMSPYVMSKWAIQALSRTLQIETREQADVHVSLVSPGAIDTGIYAKAANYVGRLSKPPPPVASAERAADTVMRVLDRPRRKAPVGILGLVSIPGFRLLPAVFDRLVTPLMDGLSFERTAVAAHPGNVFDSISTDQIRERFTMSSHEFDPAPAHVDGRATVRRQIEASRADVWAVLADGWLYPNWVVGATRMRDVEAAWPMPGSKLHHSFGVWPVVIDDATTVIECEPGSRLLLHAQGWPLGKAEVEIELADAGAGTEVSIREDAIAGPGGLIPRPVRQPVLVVRNKESLRRLAFLAEGQAADTSGA